MIRNIMVALLLAGCAAQKPQQKAVAKSEAQYSSEGQPKPKGTMHCHMEQETGSNRMERVCSYQDEQAGASDTAIDDGMIRAEQRAAQHVLPPSQGGGH